MKINLIDTSTMDIVELDQWHMAQVGYSFIEEAGGLDQFLSVYSVEDARAWVDEVWELQSA